MNVNGQGAFYGESRGKFSGQKNLVVGLSTVHIEVTNPCYSAVVGDTDTKISTFPIPVLLLSIFPIPVLLLLLSLFPILYSNTQHHIGLESAGITHLWNCDLKWIVEGRQD